MFTLDMMEIKPIKTVFKTRARQSCGLFCRDSCWVLFFFFYNVQIGFVFYFMSLPISWQEKMSKGLLWADFDRMVKKALSKSIYMLLYPFLLCGTVPVCVCVYLCVSVFDETGCSKKRTFNTNNKVNFFFFSPINLIYIIYSKHSN